MKVGVVGLGAAGLPLAAILGKYHEVTGIDINSEVVEGVNNKTYFGIEKDLKEILLESNLTASTDLKSILEMDAVILTLPSTHEDFSIIEGVFKELNKYYNGDVILSTTSPIGFTRKMQKRFSNIIISYVPMRTFEGNAINQFYEFPHMVGVFDKDAFTRISKIYTDAKSTTVLAETPEYAELAKLVSNVYRQIELAVGNQFALIADYFGLDPHKVRKLVNVGDPYRDLKAPGIWGGYCLPKDTKMLLDCIGSFNREPALIYESENLRLRLIKSKAMELMEKSKEIGIEGITNKPIEMKVPDTRNSPVLDVIEQLIDMGAKVSIYDPNISWEELEKVATEVGALPASLDEVKSKPVFARFEDFDLKIKKPE